MKLISINIEGDLHNDAVFDFIKQENPDVVCIQELLERDLDIFRHQLAFDSVYQPFMFWSNPVYPTFRGQRQGTAIFAKLIKASGAIFYTGNEENILKSFDEYLSNEQFQKNRSFVWADVSNLDGRLFRFISVQLPVTKKGETTSYQLETVELLIGELDKLGEFVLCGDMNAPRGKEAFSRLASRYKDNIPAQYQTSIDQNLHKSKGLQLMVDGLFTTPKYSVSQVRLADGLSDHMAVIALIEHR
ncbi:MAG: endonuclease/exonuclease/phosphatase family protein [Candidatus Vogelbacteria bacterium]|nr:endonuclease/exonuclease/phosphatase family protein [Candidatus Vogelbacteria bacterium]